MKILVAKELLTLLLESNTRAVFNCIAQFEGSTIQLSKRSQLPIADVRAALVKLVRFGLVKRGMKQKQVVYRINKAFVKKMMK